MKGKTLIVEQDSFCCLPPRVILKYLTIKEIRDMVNFTNPCTSWMPPINKSLCEILSSRTAMISIDMLSQWILPVLITFLWVALHYCFPKPVTTPWSFIPIIHWQTFIMYVHIQQQNSISQVYLLTDNCCLWIVNINSICMIYVFPSLKYHLCRLLSSWINA